MKKTLFSRGLYVESLRRLRVFGFIALAAMLILQLGPVIFSIVDYYTYMSHPEYIGLSVPTTQTVNAALLFLATPVTAAIVTPIMVLIVFSVFNKRSSSDFYHALPYTRICIYISSLAAVFTWVIGICLICSVAGIASYSIFPKVFTVIYDGALELLLSYLAILLLAAGGTALAMSATGTLLTNICVTLLILFLPRFIISIMTSWISNSADFLAFNVTGNSFLSYNINLLFGTVAEILLLGNLPDYFNNLPADIYSIVLGLIYLVLALLVFLTRKSETATCPAPGRAVQHIIRIMLTMVVGIFSTILFIEGEWAGFIVVSFITAVVYFAYELITTHRWKNLLRALPFYGVVVGLCILCGAIIVSVPYIASKYTPEAEKIDSVRFIDDDYSYNDQWFGAGTEDLELTDETIIKAVSETLKDNMKVYKEIGYVGRYNYYITEDVLQDGYYYEETEEAIVQTVAIKQGLITKYRTIFFSREDYSRILTALENNEEYITACKTLPKPAKGSLDFDIYSSSIDYSYYEKVFKCLQEEINALSFEKWYSVANNLSDEYAEYTLYYNSDDYDSKFVHIPISSEVFPKTFALLLETNNIDYEHRYNIVDKLINDEEFANRADLFYFYMDVTIRITDDEGNIRMYTARADYDMAGHKYREAFADMLKKAEACEGSPTADTYICINYDYSCEDESESNCIYLPYPEDFDPESWGFEEMIYDYDEGVEKY